MNAPPSSPDDVSEDVKLARVSRALLALLLPFAAFFLQWTFWSTLQPYVWFLFFPAVFFSSWLGGFGIGLTSTVISTAIVWWFFIPPHYALMKASGSYLSAGMFVVMGILFSISHGRLRKENYLANDAAIRLGRILDNSFNEIYLFDANTLRFVQANRGALVNLGYTIEELTRLTPFDIKTDVTREKFEERLESLRRGANTMLIFEATQKRKDGSLYPVEVRMHLARAGAETIGVQIVQNIAERKQAENVIRQLNLDLERRVEERTAELQGANRELDSFAYAVSHDLRAPLRAMSGFSQAMVEDYGGQLDSQARVYLDQITFASRRMGELIDGLLHLSRSTRGEISRDEVDISGLSGRLLDEMVRAEPERRVEREIQPGLCVFGDARMVEIVMRNLLANAWKYTAGKTPALIRVYAEQNGGERIFCIADNGAGFDMNHADKLFKPFQRLHRQEEFAGIGIGLATVERIIRRHGGTIRAAATPGHGAIFRFTLPAAADRDKENA